MSPTYLLLFVFCLLFITSIPSVLGKRRRSKKRNQNVDGDEMVFKDKDEMQRKVDELNAKAKAGNLKLDEDVSPSERARLMIEEKELEKKVSAAAKAYGDVSREKANALHRLGGNIFRQQKFERIIEIAKEIVLINEQIDGQDHINTGKALENLGAVLFRLGNSRIDECHNVMMRAINIFIKEYGPESKEVLLLRGKMMTFRVPDAQTTTGISYDVYKSHDEL